MARKSAHTDSSYWLTSPRGVDTCLNCTEDVCWYDTSHTGGDCPIWLATPKSDVRPDTRADEALKAIESVCLAGPISTTELVQILMDKGYYRNILYWLIDKDRLETERVKTHKSSKHKTKIMVKGIKKSA